MTFEDIAPTGLLFRAMYYFYKDFTYTRFLISNTTLIT